MSSDVAVEFTDVTKRYRLRSGRAALLDLLQRGPTEYRTALDHVSFDVRHGERVALVGNNGAGKSTALRLISRIARPTEGSIMVDGSVGALLEVGSGINLDMTARENIWLYGNILGLSRRQVADRFDTIVDFAELDHVLDQQVKYYSSGMQLRLGFSIAAHLEPDILIVDEALAVGDVRFQRKCIELMSTLASGGMTLIYVSHDLRTVEALCNRVIWIEHGRVRADGPMGEVVKAYLDTTRRSGFSVRSVDDDGELRIIDAAVVDERGNPRDSVDQGEAMRLRLTFDGPPTERPHVAVGFSAGGAQPIVVCSMAEHGTAPESVSGRWTCTLEVDRIPFRRGEVEVWVGVLAADAAHDLIDYHRVGSFLVEAPIAGGPRGLTEVGPVVVSHRFIVDAD